MNTQPTPHSLHISHSAMTRHLLWTLLALSTLHITTTTTAAANVLDPTTNDQQQLGGGEGIIDDEVPSAAAPRESASISAVDDVLVPQKLTVIAYASDSRPARHLVSFAERFSVDLHLIGVDRAWGGFNDKITGFSSFIEGLENEGNSSIVLVLDAYDTVPICSAQQFLSKFNSFGADIVMSTGKDCWPDPNVGHFLEERLSAEDQESHPFFPWFLCPNSGAIMGRHDAMLSMFRRVQKLVHIGNGSCSDFEGIHSAFTLSHSDSFGNREHRKKCDEPFCIGIC